MAFTNNPKFYHGINGAVQMERPYREADSQSFKKGQLVYLSSGYLTACASDNVNFLGIAKFDATNVTSAHVTGNVTVLRPGDEIKIRVTSGGTATRITAANLGIKYGMYVTSNVSYLDVADTTNYAFQITKILYEPDGSTVSYWCVATVLPSALQYVTGA